MPDGFTVKIEGIEDLERLLTNLTSDLRRRVVRQGLRDASKPFVTAARSMAKAHDYGSKTRIAGTMRRAITVVSSRKYNGSGGVIGVYLTVRASKAQKRVRPVSGDPFYWRWVFGGHKIVPRLPASAKALSKRQLRKAGLTITARRRAATRMVKGDPIFDRAFAQQAENAAKAFAPAILARIAKAQQGQ